VTSGAEVRFGVHVDDVLVEGRGRVVGVAATEGGVQREIRADIVIGADGLHSAIAHCVRAPRIVEGRHATAVLYSYWAGLPDGGYQWWFKPGASVGAIPTNDAATCVFVSVQEERFRDHVRGNVSLAYERMIGQVWPAFAGKLDAAWRVEPVRGFGGHVGYIKRATGPGWALVGDAGYFKDPLTAHGITDALRDAELLARAVVQGTSSALAEYDMTRMDLSRRLFEVTDEIASMAWTDEEVQALHRAFSSEMSREVRALAALPSTFAEPADAAIIAG
jgi:flavin-dependent dehydrogenase